jgi:hypothetical protein
MRTHRRLRTLTSVPAFHPTPTVQGVFSNPKVLVIQQCSYGFGDEDNRYPKVLASLLDSV